MKLLKLTGYWTPYWINNDKIVSFHQIEALKVPFPIWEETNWNNFNWTNVDRLEVIAPINLKGMEYLKIEEGSYNYYYKLIDNLSIGTRDIKGTLLCKYIYELDLYQSYIYKLLEIAINNKCLVHFKRCFRPRLKKDGNQYKLNILTQQHFTDIIPLPNLRTKRTFIKATNPREFYILNTGPNSVPWETLSNMSQPCLRQLPRWDNASTTWEVNLTDWFTNETNINGNNNYYEYIVAPSSCLRKVADNKDLSVDTTQKIVVIPLIPSIRDNIYKGLFDISITDAQTSCLVIGNPISTQMNQIPFATIWDYANQHPDKISLKYGENKTNTEELIKIPFFEMDYNLPMLKKLFSYGLTSTKGLGGKLNYLLANLDKLTPETEPLMLNPTYYYETYNNGITQLSTSLRKFVVTVNEGTTHVPRELYLQAYFHIFQGCDMSYFYGTDTNTADSSLDYTNTQTVDVSLPLSVGVGAAAKYLAENLTTGYTGLLNRENEKAAAATQTALNATSRVIGLTNPLNWIVKGVGIAKTLQTGVNIANSITQTTLEQQRADRSFYASIKNAVNAPQTITNKPFSKSSLPIYTEDNNHLFPIFAVELNEPSKNKVFHDYLNNATIYDAEATIDTFLNRKYMNILSIDVENSMNELLALWEKEFTHPIFKNKYWYTQAFSFLSDTHQFYMTPILVNCTNWNREDYLHNTEAIPINISSGKTDINTLITKFRELYQDNIDRIKAAIQEDNNLTDEVMQELVITTKTVEQAGYPISQIVVSAKENSQLYKGQVTSYIVYLYNYYVTYINPQTEQEQTYYLNKMPTNGGQSFSDGYPHIDKAPLYDFVPTKLVTDVYINDYITTIPEDFLSGYSIAATIHIPTSVTTIGRTFMSLCNREGMPEDRKLTIKIPDSVTKIGESFLFGAHGDFDLQFTSNSQLTTIEDKFLYWCDEFTCTNFKKLPPNVTRVGKAFMTGCSNFAIPNDFLVNGSIEYVGKESFNYIDEISIHKDFPYWWSSRRGAFILPSTLKVVGESFLYGCLSFYLPTNSPETDDNGIAANCPATVFYPSDKSFSLPKATQDTATALEVWGTYKNELVAWMPDIYNDKIVRRLRAARE